MLESSGYNYIVRRYVVIMNTDHIHPEIARAVLSCYENNTKDRQVSGEMLRKAWKKPNTAEGIADTFREAKADFEQLKAAGIVTWYGIYCLNADGPQWIRFQLPPCYARPTIPAILECAANGQ